MSQVRSTDIVPARGGIMTDEVGVVTGELTLRSSLDELTLAVVLSVQYRGADEWYTVTGGRCQLVADADFDAVHELAVALLHRPPDA